MKPKIVVFGIPERRLGTFSVSVYSSNGSNNYGDLVFSAQNDNTGRIAGFSLADIKIENEVTFVIMSTGTIHHAYTMKYQGGDISYVPLFEKERNTSDDQVAEEWNFAAWQTWIPRASHADGLAAEHKALIAKELVKEPIQASYYFESRVDYTEKFHKLWIGLNAYATHSSNENSDKLKILSLVNTPLRATFAEVIESVRNREDADRFRSLQHATGIDMSSNIVRDEIGRSCSVFDFLLNAKQLSPGYTSDSLKNTRQTDGLVFLSASGPENFYFNIYRKYHEYMASEQGIVLPFDLADAFKSPTSPNSLKRYGRLLFHDPFEDNSAGSLFSVADYFGSDYANSPYAGQLKRNGQPNPELRKYEKIDPLFFRYLNLLYDFRCAYFHGSLSTNEQNNELARTAYTSLREIYPAILR
jgi:hypothetical protein